MACCNRRRFLEQGALACLALAGGRRLCAQPPDPERSAAEMLTPRAELAIRRGLEYLDRRQGDDGALGSGSFRGNVGITALGGLAFLASGSTPGRGPYGQELLAAIDYLLDHTEASGYIIAPRASSHGPMYGHGFSVLFLAEAYGMAPQPKIRAKLSEAVKLIVDSQNPLGGWRYHPGTPEADISVTVAQVMALRAARNAGLSVPKETIDRALDYVKRCQNPDGGFMYMLPAGPSEFPRSAAALVALYSAGVYEGPALEQGLDYVLAFVPRGRPTRGDDYYYYGHYYAVQAMWYAGGKYWQAWYPAIRDELVMNQRDDGSWFDPISPEYATAMACLILQVPSNYLPIFQR